MKSKITILLTILLIVPLFAQTPFSNTVNPNYFSGGLGMTWIDGRPFTTFSINPEFTFGNFGLGLRLELLFDNNNNFKFRSAGWEDASAVFRSIQYVRYGYKGNPVYVRLGSLVAATIGHGFLMWQYSNEANYDQRKFGAVLDLDFDHVGFESVVSDLGNIHLYGGRIYVRPLFSLEVPVVSNLEFGGSVITDQNPDANKETDDDKVLEWGVDVGLPVIKSEIFKTILYFDYAKFADFGEGKAAGINVGFPDIAGVFNLDARLERRWIGDQFIPSYFNTSYELERNLGFGLDKKSRLKAAKSSQGIFGLLAGQFAGLFRLSGSYQHQDGIPHSGILHLEATLMDLVPNIRFISYYDKTNIETFEDARTLDVFSQAVMELGYVTYEVIMVSLRYRWNFVETSPGVYTPQERFEPRVSFVYEF